MPRADRLAFLLLTVALRAGAGELTPLERDIAAHVDAGESGAIALLGRTVDIPSASENAEGVRRVGEVFAAELRGLGFATTWVELPPEMKRGGHLVAERKGGRGTRLLLIGHLDTVLQAEPFRREGGRGYGSGASDTKGGDVLLIEALRALHAAGALEDRRIVVVMTGDEEDTGSPYEVSRQPLVEAARRSDCVLSFEGAEAGFGVTGRRGTSSWRLEVQGSQGHSSGIFGDKRGSGAIYEVARILNAFHAMPREPYLTFNPSVIVGGTDVAYDAPAASGRAHGKTNVVPRQAVAEGDLRFLTREQLDSARRTMRDIVARSLPKTSATITFEDGFPSMAPTEGSRELLRVLDAVSRDLGAGGIAENDPATRGAGDISFVADIIPGLDGLGAMGENEHAPGEYVELDTLRLLTKRAALLIHRLTR